MQPVKHPSCNDVLRKPDGMTEEECGDLHIRREEGAVWSFWKPEPEELAAIVAGGTVALRVSGTTHPPLNILATAPIERRNPIPPDQAIVFSAAIDRRYQALLSLTKRAFGAWTRETTERSRDHNRLTDEFLDLLTLNKGKGGEIVREAPVPQPETVQAATIDNDAARYRADAEGWKIEAERFEGELRKISAALGDEWNIIPFPEAITSLKNRLDVAEGWKEEAERWRATAEAKQTNIDWLNQQLANAVIAPAELRRKIKAIREDHGQWAHDLADEILALPELNPEPPTA